MKIRLFLNSVGEPLNHEAWEWYNNLVGEKRCPIVDTWWQTGKFISVLKVLLPIDVLPKLINSAMKYAK